MSMYPPQNGEPPPGGPQPMPGPGVPPGGAPYAPVPPAEPKKKSRAPLVLGIVAGVVLLCCGGSVAAYYVTDGGTKGGSASADASSDPTASPTSSDEDVAGDLNQFETGDCMLISENNDVERADCTDKGAYKVFLRKDGTISDAPCKDTPATTSLYQDVEGSTAQDFVLCVGPASAG